MLTPESVGEAETECDNRRWGQSPIASGTSPRRWGSDPIADPWPSAAGRPGGWPRGRPAGCRARARGPRPASAATPRETPRRTRRPRRSCPRRDRDAAPRSRRSHAVCADAPSGPRLTTTSFARLASADVIPSEQRFGIVRDQESSGPTPSRRRSAPYRSISVNDEGSNTTGMPRRRASASSGDRKSVDCRRGRCRSR